MMEYCSPSIERLKYLCMQKGCQFGFYLFINFKVFSFILKMMIFFQSMSSASLTDNFAPQTCKTKYLKKPQDSYSFVFFKWLYKFAMFRHHESCRLILKNV